MLGIGVMIGCAGDGESGEGRDAGGARAPQEVSERGGGESGGEHAGGAEGAEGGGEGGGEGASAGGEEASASQLAPDGTFEPPVGPVLVDDVVASQDFPSSTRRAPEPRVPRAPS